MKKHVIQVLARVTSPRPETRPGTIPLGHSITRCVAVGVGANSRAGNAAGKGDMMSAVIMSHGLMSRGGSRAGSS
jgi:hypothetical protein